MKKKRRKNNKGDSEKGKERGGMRAIQKADGKVGETKDRQNLPKGSRVSH